MPMASITRSNRRAEGLHLYDRNVNASGPLTRSGPGPNSFHHGSAAAGGRTKRALDVAEREFEAIRHKKTRIAVELLAKPTLPVEPVNVQPPPIPRRAAVATSASRQPVPPVQPTKAPAAPISADAEPQDSSLTKHQAKVINGIKHELDRLQPRQDDTKEQGRKLRSQEATRFKSELSAYFPDYDEVIGNDPKEEREQPFPTPRKKNCRANSPSSAGSCSSAILQWFSDELVQIYLTLRRRLLLSIPVCRAQFPMPIAQRLDPTTKPRAASIFLSEDMAMRYSPMSSTLNVSILAFSKPNIRTKILKIPYLMACLSQSIKRPRGSNDPSGIRKKVVHNMRRTKSSDSWRACKAMTG